MNLRLVSALVLSSLQKRLPHPVPRPYVLGVCLDTIFAVVALNAKLAVLTQQQ